jgi:hypothetical protein
MSREDLECPYCGCGMEVCHDDGFGYDEDVLHEQECGECGKLFVFNTSISFHYSGHKADCLNGAAHKYEKTHTYPVRYTRMRCADCGDERDCTDEEMLGVTDRRNK